MATKKYIGTKIVLAEPMTAMEFTQTRGGRVPGGNPAPDAPGYLVIYEDGYTSWSPKDTFERASREITQAEMELLTGSKGPVAEAR